MTRMTFKVALELDLQNPFEFINIPSVEQFQQWVDVGFQEENNDCSVVIRVTTEAESQQLNHAYRQKDAPTNVLSFPFEMPDLLELSFAEPHHLGDLVFCEPVIVKEAVEQNKILSQHWAHLVIHGMLHLQGFDHINDDDATIMESKEIQLLNQIDFPNPYE